MKATVTLKAGYGDKTLTPWEFRFNGWIVGQGVVGLAAIGGATTTSSAIIRTLAASAKAGYGAKTAAVTAKAGYGDKVLTAVVKTA